MMKYPANVFEVLHSLSIDEQEWLGRLLEEKKKEREICQKERQEPWLKHRRQLGFQAIGKTGDLVVAEETAPYDFKGMKLICKGTPEGTVIKTVTVAGKKRELNITTEQFTKDTMLSDQWWEPIKKGERISFLIEFPTDGKWMGALIGRKTISR